MGIVRWLRLDSQQTGRRFGQDLRNTDIEVLILHVYIRCHNKPQGSILSAQHAIKNKVPLCETRDAEKFLRNAEKFLRDAVL